MFFDPAPERREQALAVCARCPARRDCLDEALALEDADCVRGGRVIDRRGRLLPTGGTCDLTYAAHYRRGEKPCPECRDTYNAARKLTRR